MRRVDRKFAGWHMLYSVILVAWGLLFLLSNNDCLGREPGYWVLGFGALPSLALLVTGYLKPAVAYWAAMVYGAIIALGVLGLLSTTHSYLWVVVFFPLFAYIVEAVVIFLRRGSLFCRD